MTCPKCKIGKVYIKETDKKGKILETKCIMCNSSFKGIPSEIK